MTAERLIKRIMETKKTIASQQDYYAKIAAETNSSQERDFFLGLLAGLFDELKDLDWILETEEVEE